MREPYEIFCFTNIDTEPNPSTGTLRWSSGGCPIVTLSDSLSNNGQGKHTLLATIAMVTIQHTVPAIPLIKPQQAQRLPISQITVATAIQPH